MTRSNRGSKPPGYDYWSRRPYSDWGYGPHLKRLCHRAERREATQIIQDQLSEGEAMFVCSRCGVAVAESERSPGTRECIWC